MFAIYPWLLQKRNRSKIFSGSMPVKFVAEANFRDFREIFAY